ncbi:MAG: divalent metal cation transporter [Candidatus Komeilibacteria bacterium]|nr:divalent metal cation transporter [Candidatus Komeilibacteria bacterium]
MYIMANRFKKFWRAAGPGIITGASDDDPSGIATYSQTGAQFGYGQLWTAFFSLPFMIVIQEMCGRIGMVTGRGLSGVIRAHYSRELLYGAVLLLLFANTVNIGADLGAMAAALQLIVDLPFIFLLLAITALTLILEIFVSYKNYAHYLKWLKLSLFAYFITAFVVKQDWSKVLYSTFIPMFSTSQAYMMNIVAFLGTTISPYLFFWQASQEVEEEVESGKLVMMGRGVPKVTRGDIRNMRFDTIIGMLFSNLAAFFIILTVASTLGKNGIFNIDTAAQAAEALRPLAGNFAFLLFTIGIIGVGLLGVPVLAGSASYAVSEAFGWRSGLYRKLKQAHGFYGVITIATIVGLLINFLNIPPFKMLYYTAVLNGLVAPLLMILIMLIGGNKNIMGKHANSRLSSIMGWLITLIMLAASGALLYSFLS